MPNHQAIITELAKVRVEVKAGCKTCGGSGIVSTLCCERDEQWNECAICGGAGFAETPCPDYAEVRALDLCWHSCEKGTIDKRYIPEEVYYCDGCGEGPRTFKDDWGNPDLTTHMHGSKLWLVHVMQVLGVWDKFMLQHFKQALYVKKFRESSNNVFTVKLGGAGAIYDILTDGEKLVLAVEAWLKEREG